MLSINIKGFKLHVLRLQFKKLFVLGIHIFLSKKVLYWTSYQGSQQWCNNHRLRLLEVDADYLIQFIDFWSVKFVFKFFFLISIQWYDVCNGNGSKMIFSYFSHNLDLICYNKVHYPDYPTVTFRVSADSPMNKYVCYRLSSLSNGTDCW